MANKVYTIEGTRPLLMHNSQLLDPLNEWTKFLKQITSKRSKTDADHDELAKREFMGSLYLNEDKAPCIPDHVLEACIIAGAKKFKLGTAVKSSVMVLEPATLEYEGPKTADDLWAQKFFLRTNVKVAGSGVIRTRPMFPVGWKATFEVSVDTDTLSIDDLDRCIAKAGEVAGVGDYRPKYGRFKLIEVPTLV